MNRVYTEERFEENFPGANFTDEEREFLLAMERYQRERGRRWPTWHEVLAVARSLGYRRVAEPAALPTYRLAAGQKGEAP
jgi:hypothetical protein